MEDRMRLLLMFICLFGLVNLSVAKDMSSQIQVKTKVPEGVVIKKNKVTVKKGYVIEKQSNNKAIARMSGGKGGITGEFDCTCNGEQGGCSVVTTPNSVTCASSGCSSCYMIVTIPDKAGSVMHR
jgi:hypothetical protein